MSVRKLFCTADWRVAMFLSVSLDSLVAGQPLTDSVL
jgi:hypothetical protein